MTIFSVGDHIWKKQDKSHVSPSILKRLVMWLAFHFIDPIILICFGWKCLEHDGIGWIWQDPCTKEWHPQGKAINICEKRDT